MRDNKYICFDDTSKRKTAKFALILPGLGFLILLLLPAIELSGKIYWIFTTGIYKVHIILFLNAVVLISSFFVLKNKIKLKAALLFISALTSIILLIHVKNYFTVINFYVYLNAKPGIPLTYFVFMILIGFSYLFVGLYAKSKTAKYLLVFFSTMFLVSFFIPLKYLNYYQYIIRSLKGGLTHNYLIPKFNNSCNLYYVRKYIWFSFLKL